MKTVILNPSWEACGRMLLEVVKHGDSDAAKEGACDEILKGLRGYDAMLAKHTDYFEEREVEMHPGDAADAAEYMLTDR